MSRERGGYSSEAVERIFERYQAEKRKRPTDEARDAAVEKARREGLEVPGENTSPEVRRDGWPAKRMRRRFD